MKKAPIPDNDSARLSALLQLKILDTPPEERFDRITRVAQKLFDVPIALVSLVDESRQWFKSCLGLDVMETPREISFCGHAIIDDEILCIPDTKADERFADNPVVTGPLNVRFYAGAPLKTLNGYRLGTLCIIDSRPREFSTSDLNLLRDLADSIEEQINRDELAVQTQLLKQTKKLNDVITRAQSDFIKETDRSLAFNGLLNDILDLTDSEYGFIGEVLHTEKNRPFLKTYAITDIAWNKETQEFYNKNAPTGLEFLNLKSLFGEALTTQQPVIANDPKNDPRRSGIPPGHPDLNAFLGIPIHYHGTLVAMIGVANRPGGYDQNLLDFLQPLSMTIGQLVYASQAQARQNKSDRRLGAVIEGINVGTWEWHIQTGETIFNDRWAQILGYSLDELQPTTFETWKRLTHPEDHDEAIKKIESHFAGEIDFYDYALRMKHKQGRWVWIATRGSVMERSKDGTPLVMYGTHTDISEQKEAELELTRNSEQLREAQSLAHIGSWQADIITGALSWSDEIYRIFGYAPGSIKPSVEVFHSAIHPDDLEKVLQSEKQAEKTGQHDITHRIVRPDDSIRYVHELAQAELDDAGNLIRLTGTVQDITKQVEAEHALITAKEEAERANAAKSAFLSSMSHELRTPMNAILGFTQLMELDDNLLPTQKDNVSEILKAGKHLLSLIDEVLDLAKIESGNLDLSIENVEILPIVEECANLIQPLASKRGISLNYTNIPHIAINADRTRVKQALLNLLSNAIKYNRRAGSVEIFTESTDDDFVNLFVKDTGPGIEPSRVSELFQPFNRLGAESSSIEGTGIGLTLTRQLLQLMNGSVEFETSLGKGSTFWLKLPQASLSNMPNFVDQRNTANYSSRNIENIKKRLVLYIEDNPANIKLVSQILKRKDDIKLVTAHTADLGLQLATSQIPDVILLDINLPGMDGYELLKRLQNSELLSTIPVIAITANAMPSDIKQGKAAGFQNYLTKPLNIEHFIQNLDECLREEELT